MRWRLVLSLALLLAPALAAAQATPPWDELAGGSARLGAAFLPATTLDVLESRDLFGNDTEIALQYSKGLVETPQGLLALAQRDDECVLLGIEEDGVQERVLDRCRGGTLTAYDRARDRILVCSVGASGEPVLQARDVATGAIAWGLTPTQAGAPGDATVSWRCVGTALSPEEGVGYVAIYYVVSASFAATGGDARIVRFDLDSGAVLWSRPLGASNFLNPVDLMLTKGGFLPFGLSVTQNGLIVSGRTSCACGKGDPSEPSTQQGAVAWMGKESGFVRGAALAEDDASAAQMGALPERYYGQWWATTQGPLGAFALGGRVVVVNPAEQEPVRESPFEGVATGRGYSGIIPSAWWADAILVPMDASVTVVDAQTLETLGSRTFASGGVVSAMVVLPPSEALVLVVHSENASRQDAPATVHRLDLRTLDELQRIHLPGAIRATSTTGRAAFHPLEDGRLLVFSLDGRMITLGPAPQEALPRLVLSTEYPAPSEAVTLEVASPLPEATYMVAWGDDTVEETGTSWSHRYGDAGPRTARVTAIFPDGRTATSEVLVRVGATPPPQLTAIQKAFAPERQDLTFGLLGVALTLVGGAIAVVARRRRHGRLHEELQELERVRELGRRDPERAMRELGMLRERLLTDVGTHRLEDGQFNTLDARANVVFSALRMRLLGPLAGHLSADFRHALDVVLHDGVVEREELEGLRAAVEAERQLSPEQRMRLLALLERLARRE